LKTLNLNPNPNPNLDQICGQFEPNSGK
jgi:hypothetical protein